jgi:hypothetical protein
LQSARAITKKFDMTDLSTSSPAVKASPDTARERDFLLNALRVASARAQLANNVFNTVGTSLRHRQINCQEALEWISEEGLLHHVDLEPPMKKSGGAS